MSTVSQLKKDRQTPGVYITEFPAFPPAIAGVATAIPVFIGYTETALDPASHRPAYLKAIPINSMADYIAAFGYGYDTKYEVSQVNIKPASKPAPDEKAGAGATAPEPAPDNLTLAARHDFQANIKNGNIVSSGDFQISSNGLQFNLYMAMQLFYANGGGQCFVISAGNYWNNFDVQPNTSDPAVAVSAQRLLEGLEVSNDMRGPTMIVVPDACLLDAGTDGDGADYGKVVRSMLTQAKTLQDRVAILDLPDALDPASWSKAILPQKVSLFQTAIDSAQNCLSYGAAYGPAVKSSIYTKDDVTFSNLRNSEVSRMTMNNLLNTQACILYTDTALKAVQDRIAQAFPVAPSGNAEGDANKSSSYAYLDPDVNHDNLKAIKADPVKRAMSKTILDQYLVNALPLYGQIQQILVSKRNAAPPSGIMAGIWTANDSNRGVWNAPANISLSSVIIPKVVLNDQDQSGYNAPLNGKAINILRSMVGRGTVVWGARTLDANSLDYRYIQVRRTLIYIEQSIKLALQQFVFAPNTGTTWTTVTAAISNFLTNLWQSGGLMGDKASDAFTVQCGLGSTMTGMDILNGYMIVNVTVQMVHPAEFIELTFTQTMQGV